MDKSSKLIRIIVEVAIFAALGFVFDELQGAVSKAIFPTGGSIGFALSVVVVLSFRRGSIVGFFVGLIIGLLDFATGPYILNFWQILLDYIFPYSIVALSGLFKPWFDKEDNKKIKFLNLLLATFVGGMGKFFMHFLSGGLFFAEFINWPQFEGQPWLYSLAYNMAAVGPSTLLSMAILAVLYLRASSLFEMPIEVTNKAYKQFKLFDFVLNPSLIGTGLFLFIFFLIKYIQSAYHYVDGQFVGVDFDQDALFLFITGALLVVTATISIIKFIRKTNNYRLITVNLCFITFSNFVYGLARLIKMYVKGKDPNIYWIWMSVGLFLNFVCVVLYLYIKKNEENESQKAN